MSGWEVWSRNSGVVDAVFPRLQELQIRAYPNLAEVSLEALPSPRVLRISSCGDGVLRSLVHVASVVTKLSINDISGLSYEVWRGVMDYLGAVEELSIGEFNEIKYMWESEAEACKALVNLRILALSSCHNLERCNLPNNIQELIIYDCPMIVYVSFLTGGNKKLKSLIIDGCEQLPDTELLNTSMLEVLWISSWENLNSIYELTCCIHITKLIIADCSSIESFPTADSPNLTSLKHLTLRDCKSMDVDSFGFWPPKLGFLGIGGLKKPISKLGLKNFPPSLVGLTLYGGSAEEEEDVTSGSQLSHMLPSSLTNLELWCFEKLESASKGLQHLTSLQHLFVYNFPKLKDLP